MVSKKHAGLEKPDEFGVFEWDARNPNRAERREHRSERKRLEKKYKREVNRAHVNFIPGPLYGRSFMGFHWSKGAKRQHNFRNSMKVIAGLRSMTSLTFASAYPYVASGSLGVPGVLVGKNKLGGGGFYFDPWELYKAGKISGTFMVLLGAVGTGKSTCAKTIVSRMVQHGRKALVMTDMKGEWAKVASYLRGLVISIGAGQLSRVNPLDEGNRPSTDEDGNPMTDEVWASMVKSRRMALMTACCEILEERRLFSNEHLALGYIMDAAVEKASAAGRMPIISDLNYFLVHPKEEWLGRETLQEAFATLSDTMERLVSGDMAGLFDGESTVVFDAQAPIVVFNTAPLQMLSPEAQKIAHACLQTWGEAAVTNSDSGKRIVVYEEGSEALKDPATLRRMSHQVKLARAYGLCNLWILHKLGDLDMAGDKDSKEHSTAYSLLGDSSIQVIYRQSPSQKAITMDKLGVTDRLWKTITSLSKGEGLWLIENKPFVVKNLMTAPERPVFDTDARMVLTDEDERAMKVGI